VSGADGFGPAGAGSGRVAEPAVPVGEDETVTAAGPRRQRAIRLEKVVQLARAVADAEPGKIESAARQFGESRPYLAPVAWAAGTIVLLIRGVKLLVLNWRLSLIQLVPAGWIWLVMWDLKQHALRGAPFRHVTLGGVVLFLALAVAVSTAAFWCNTVFAFAIDVLPPQIRPAIRHTNRRLTGIVSAGLLLGVALAFAVAIVPRINQVWLYVLTLGAVLGVMLISFVAVPAHIIGRKQQKLPPKQAIGRTATGWALSGVAMTPGFVLDRIGLILLGVSHLQVLGFALLSIGTALYAAGLSSVKAVKMSIKFAPTA
jgi:hypothetical protein